MGDTGGDDDCTFKILAVLKGQNLAELSKLTNVIIGLLALSSETLIDKEAS